MDALTGPACAACGAAAVVHWQRRLTADEIAQQQAIEQERRREIALLADPDQPPPLFPPMPDYLDAATVVYSCAQHSISLDAASLTHQATCSAPPACDCTPEAVPDPEPDPDPVILPAGW